MGNFPARSGISLGVSGKPWTGVSSEYACRTANCYSGRLTLPFWCFETLFVLLSIVSTSSRIYAYGYILRPCDGVHAVKSAVHMVESAVHVVQLVVDASKLL